MCITATNDNHTPYSHAPGLGQAHKAWDSGVTSQQQKSQFEKT